MLGKEFTGKSCYANFFKLKNKIMLGEFHVSRIHVRQGLPVVPFFCNFKNGQKSIFELGKLPKMQFHEKKILIYLISRVFCLDYFIFSGPLWIFWCYYTLPPKKMPYNNRPFSKFFFKFARLSDDAITLFSSQTISIYRPFLFKVSCFTSLLASLWID